MPAVEADVVGQVADLALDRERLAGRVEAQHADDALGRLGQAEQHQDRWSSCRRRSARAGRTPRPRGSSGRACRPPVKSPYCLVRPAGDDDGVVGDVGEEHSGDRARRRSLARRPRSTGLGGRDVSPGPGGSRRARPRGRSRSRPGSRPRRVPRPGRRLAGGPAAPSRSSGVRSLGHGPTAGRTSGRPSRARRTRRRSAATPRIHQNCGVSTRTRIVDVVGRLGRLRGHRHLVVARDGVAWSGVIVRGDVGRVAPGRSTRRDLPGLNSNFQPVGGARAHGDVGERRGARCSSP